MRRRVQETFRHGRAGRAALGAVCATLCVSSAAFAQVDIRFYGDTDARVDHTSAGVTTASAQVPLLDLFTTGQYERWSFIGEVAFEFTPQNTLGVDAERLQVGFLVNDYLRLSVGRFHTAFGYFNDAYHHGTYHQLTAARPDSVQFEDKGGLIPAHMIGIHADGRLPLGSVGKFDYALEVGNGRGEDTTVVTSYVDPNNYKAVNVRLRFSPEAVEDLTVGFNALIDRLPAGSSSPTPEQDELLLGVHAVYIHHPIHLLAEAFWVRHQETASRILHRAFAAFLEAGYSFGIIEPFVRYEWVGLSDNSPDPFYAPSSTGGSRHNLLAGIKLTINDHIAIKVEARSAFLTSGANTVTGLAQVGYAF